MFLSKIGAKVNVFRPSFSHSYSQAVNNFTVVHLNSPPICALVFLLPEMWDKVSVITPTAKNPKLEVRKSKQTRISKPKGLFLSSISNLFRISGSNFEFWGRL